MVKYTFKLLIYLLFGLLLTANNLNYCQKSCWKLTENNDSQLKYKPVLGNFFSKNFAYFLNAQNDSVSKKNNYDGSLVISCFLMANVGSNFSTHARLLYLIRMRHFLEPVLSVLHFVWIKRVLGLFDRLFLSTFCCGGV